MGQLEQTHNLQLNWHSVWILTNTIRSCLLNLCVCWRISTTLLEYFSEVIRHCNGIQSCFTVFDVMLISLVARAPCFRGSSDCGCLRTCVATGWVLVSQPKTKWWVGREAKWNRIHNNRWKSTVCLFYLLFLCKILFYTFNIYTLIASLFLLLSLLFCGSPRPSAIQAGRLGLCRSRIQH